MESIVLSEQNDVRREGDVVTRPAGPWTPAVNTLLRHLRSAGFTGCPEVVGEGIDTHRRQRLTYIEGEQASARGWSEDGIAAVAAMLRELHDAAASFVPPADAVWQPWHVHRTAGRTIISHGDVGPWNVITQNGTPVAFIDWDFAGPVDRLDEVAEAARLHCQLHGEDVAEIQGLLPAADRAHQLRLFADSYGLDSDERSDLVDRMVWSAVRGAANDADEARITPSEVGPHEMVWGMAWQARGGRWILDNRSLLEAALGLDPT